MPGDNGKRVVSQGSGQIPSRADEFNTTNKALAGDTLPVLEFLAAETDLLSFPADDLEEPQFIDIGKAGRLGGSFFDGIRQVVC